MVLKSYSKLNLLLSVRNKRRDNFHSIQTLFERIDLFDRISLAKREDGLISVRCDHPAVPVDETNLCYRSAKLLQDFAKVKKGVTITLDKRVPVGAGLGGGSGNAATVLLGLNKLWKLGLSRGRLASLAAKVGSDVPFFIYDCSFALGLGRGERIKLLPGLADVRLWHILVVPDIKVSTPLIYQKWDEFCGLTAPVNDVKILISVLGSKNLSEIDKYLFNSLEPVTKRLYPEVKQVEKALKMLKLRSILMSGSGPAVFGIVSSRRKALELSGKLVKQHSSWRVFVTRTA